MLFAQKYYSKEQMRGFKNELFFRYYFRQDIKNPLTYLKVMKEAWRNSVEWTTKLKSRIPRGKTEKLADEV